jgi:photoactive yellow protein
MVARETGDHHSWFEALDDVGAEALDALPVGLIRLDREGRILHYNTAESHLARRAPEEVLGKNFFDEVAPCTQVREFKGRFVEGVQRRDLFETFHFSFRFPWREVGVRITLFYSRVSDTVWALIEPETSHG